MYSTPRYLWTLACPPLLYCTVYMCDRTRASVGTIVVGRGGGGGGVAPDRACRREAVGTCTRPVGRAEERRATRLLSFFVFFSPIGGWKRCTGLMEPSHHGSDRRGRSHWRPLHMRMPRGAAVRAPAADTCHTPAFWQVLVANTHTLRVGVVRCPLPRHPYSLFSHGA